MKKFTSILLVLFLLLSSTSLSVFAEKLDEPSPLPAKSPKASSTTPGAATTTPTTPKIPPKYGLQEDGSYVDATFGWGSMGNSFNFNVSPTAPGKVRKTEVEEFSITDDNGKVHKKNFNIVYEEWVVFGEKEWVRMTTAPTTRYPVGLCLATGNLTYDKLPQKAKQWHDAGAYDSVDYYPAFGVYHFSHYIPLHSAIKLGLISKDSLSTPIKELLTLDPSLTYMTYTIYNGSVSDEVSITFDVAIKAGFIKESDIPPAAHKAWKAGKYTMYYHSGHKGGFTSSQFDCQNYD